MVCNITTAASHHHRHQLPNQKKAIRFHSENGRAEKTEDEVFWLPELHLVVVFDDQMWFEGKCPLKKSSLNTFLATRPPPLRLGLARPAATRRRRWSRLVDFRRPSVVRQGAIQI